MLGFDEQIRSRPRNVADAGAAKTNSTSNSMSAIEIRAEARPARSGGCLVQHARSPSSRGSLARVGVNDAAGMVGASGSGGVVDCPTADAEACWIAGGPVALCRAMGPVPQGALRHATPSRSAGQRTFRQGPAAARR